MSGALELLRQRFLAGLERRIGELISLAERHDFPALERAFHSLVGIGGTYGHYDITHAARDGEQACAVRDIARVHDAIAALDALRGCTVAA